VASTEEMTETIEVHFAAVGAAESERLRAFLASRLLEDPPLRNADDAPAED
jgi:hypothetical protein